MRLYQVAGATTTRFLYDGTDAISEYNGSNALQRRFVFDPTTDRPVLWYEGSGTLSTAIRYLSQDERGSVISVSTYTGALFGSVPNTYDEYGKPGSGNVGRFQYTGQMWISEIGAYYYKARVYLPHLGIFAQTDPIGQGSSPNLYAYVRNDPVNATDPSGTSCTPGSSIGSVGEDCSDIVIMPHQNAPIESALPVSYDVESSDLNLAEPELNLPEGDLTEDDIVVTAQIVPIPSTPTPPTLQVVAAPPKSSKNYCGPEGGRTYPNGTWNEACAAHDKCYAEQRNKITCDIILGIDVTEQCIAGHLPLSVLLPGPCIVIGTVFGGGVLVGGGGAYDRSRP
jgi:RHS repeat-associated protein